MIKNLLIFGDSYSTHRAYISKEFPTYYCDGGQGPDEPVTDMRWEQIYDQLMQYLSEKEVM